MPMLKYKSYCEKGWYVSIVRVWAMEVGVRAGRTLVWENWDPVVKGLCVHAPPLWGKGHGESRHDQSPAFP